MDRYVAAVKLLFDPDNAQVDLLSLEVKVGWLGADGCMMGRRLDL